MHDPTSRHPFGLAEVKWPYSRCNMTPLEAADAGDFCSTNASGEESLQLKHSHPYYCQVITEREWCDFMLYTEKGIHMECILFDSEFSNSKLLPKCIVL